jgi:ATP phosphoribosyltransferase
LRIQHAAVAGLFCHAKVKKDLSMSSGEVITRAVGAESVLCSQRNVGEMIKWFSNQGVEVPPFTGRSIFQQVGGRRFAIARNGDISREVVEGSADVAFYGSDKYNELNGALKKRLEFAPLGTLACRFALMHRQGESLSEEPLTVATSYEEALVAFMDRHQVPLGKIISSSGKLERFPASGETDAAFDLVESGASMRDNGLQIALKDGLPLQGEPVEFGLLWRQD